MLSPMPWAWPASSTLVQDQGIFHAQDEGCDGTGSNLIGFYGLKGKLRTNLLRLMPFPFALPTFVPSDAAHCAIRLRKSPSPIFARKPSRPSRARQTYGFPTPPTNSRMGI
jgi:hypothetical protein